MKHYGDICKINGALVDAVDVITGGSPCQDLSLAGKRAGLAGERSGLFMEQIRIIKEMRNVPSNDNRGMDKCRFMVWENVYGAFSSNGGEDFRAVLEETVRVKDKDAVIPGPPKEGWPHAGVIIGDGYSLAWRGHDAQWWGVPQRRKRICLLADFDGDAAARVLFESELWRTTNEGNPYQVVADSATECGCEIQPVTESVSGDFEPGRETRQGVATDSESGIGETGRCLNPWDVQSKHIQSENGVAESLYSGECRYGGGESYVMAYGISSYESNSFKSGNPESGVYEADTARTLSLNGGNPACNQGGTAVCFRGDAITSPINASNPKPGDPCHTLINDGRNYVVQGVDAYNQSMTGEVSKTLNSIASDSDHVPCVMEQRVYDPSRRHGYQEFKDVANTMQAQMGTGGGNVPIVVSDVAATRSAQDGRGGVHSQMLENPEQNFVLEPVVLESNQNHATTNADGICNTLPASMGMGGGYVPMVTEPYTSTKASYHSRFTNDGKAETLVATDYKDPPTVFGGYVVRRLTPTECMRLQGYPDDWCDLGEWTDDQGKVHKESDTPKYKAAGNSIALPFWQWLADRICKEYSRPVRMASLFDGIGGFPLVFSRCGAEPVWCSEIEPFPDAVTKARFKDG